MVQAADGIAALPSYRGQDPAYVPGVMADKVAALTATYGVMAAIAARACGKTGPIEVEAAMFEAIAAFVLNEHLAAAAFGGPPEGPATIACSRPTAGPTARGMAGSPRCRT